MNELQQKEFELLKVFTEICVKNNLKYYLVCGSALGAVKYKGFIPWDDDIDVAMLRDDYEKFCLIANKYLPEYIFLQTYKTEPEFKTVYAKLRNSLTTFIEVSAADKNMNHGINIDIFPLDGYPSERKVQRCLEFRKNLYAKILSVPYKRNSRLKEWIVKPFRLLFSQKTYDRVIKKYDEMIKRYPVSDSAVLANHGNWQGKLDYAEKEVFGQGVSAQFEGLSVIIPGDYDAYLKRKYGDYKQDLPESEQKSHHIFEVIDVNKPYTDYLKK